MRNRCFSLRPTLFFSRLDDFIVVSEQKKINAVMGITSTSARSYENIEAQLWGGEVSWSIGFSRSLMLLGGVSYTRGLQFAGPGNTAPSGNMAEVPPLKTRASLRYGNSLFFGEINMLATSRQDNVAPYLLEQTTAGYTLLGLKGGIHHKKLSFSAGVENLTNRFYYQHMSYQRDPDRIGTRIPEPGRTVFTNVSFNFE